jgi:hypothetical protein
MQIIRKDAALTPTGSPDDMPGTFRVILSAPTLDRDGETLEAKDWEMPLPEHITFDADHGMTVATTVGSGVPSIEEATGNLIVDGTYSSLPRAQEVRTLVKEGHIRTTSVAFMTKASSAKGAAKGAKVRELLNGAFVAVPSNREALVLESKSTKAGARNSKSDSDLIQQLHDISIELGASPDVAAAADDAKAAKAAKRYGTKAVAGSVEAIQDRVRDALQDAYPGAWVWLRATVPDGSGGGTVVYAVEDPDTYDEDLYQQAYTDDGSVVALTGERSAVDLMEVIKPDADEESAGNADEGAAPAPAAAAPAAAAAAKAAPTEEEAAEIQVRASRIRIRQMQTIAASTNPKGD